LISGDPVNGGGAAGDIEFAVDALEVLGDRPGADVESSGDATVGAALGDQVEDLQLAVGQAGQLAVTGRGQGVPGLVALGGARPRDHQRRAQDTEHVTLGLGEVAVGAVERDPDDLRIGARQADSELVLDGEVAEELGIEPQAVETPPADEVADLDRAAVTGGTVVVHQRVLVYVRGEDGQAARRDEACGMTAGVNLILWSMLAVVGCAAFAALGMWALVTDEHTRAQRRTITAQPIPVPSRVGIPLWLVFKHPDHAAGPVAVQAPPEVLLSEPAEHPVAAARELAGV
jgi:hypothetical protein